MEKCFSKGKIKLICKQCEKEFEVIESQKNKKYCSQKCYGKSQKGRKYSKEKYPNFGMRNKHISEETRKKLEGRVSWNKGLTKETDKRVARCSINISKSLKGRIAWNKGLTKKTDERVAKNAKNIKIAMNRLETKTKHRVAMNKPEYKKKQRDIAINNWANSTRKEDYRKRMIESWANSDSKYNSKKSRKIRREKAIKNWKDPKYQEIQAMARHMKPNKLERYFDKITPDVIRYTGGGGFFIRCKIGIHLPDFKIKGQKKVIELFGNYWHKGENPEILIGEYKAAGYKCLIFWEDEIHNKTEDIIAKVMSFIEQ